MDDSVLTISWDPTSPDTAIGNISADTIAKASNTFKSTLRGFFSLNKSHYRISFYQVEISCYPTDVPEQIDLKIDNLEINAALSVSDIDTGSEDIDLISDASLKIVSITTPVSEEVADEEVEKDEDLEGKARSDEKSDESSKESSDENTEN